MGGLFGGPSVSVGPSGSTGAPVGNLGGGPGWSQVIEHAEAQNLMQPVYDEYLGKIIKKAQNTPGQMTAEEWSVLDWMANDPYWSARFNLPSPDRIEQDIMQASTTPVEGADDGGYIFGVGAKSEIPDPNEPTAPTNPEGVTTIPPELVPYIRDGLRNGTIKNQDDINRAVDEYNRTGQVPEQERTAPPPADLPPPDVGTEVPPPPEIVNPAPQEDDVPSIPDMVREAWDWVLENVPGMPNPNEPGGGTPAPPPQPTGTPPVTDPGYPFPDENTPPGTTQGQTNPQGQGGDGTQGPGILDILNPIFGPQDPYGGDPLGDILANREADAIDRRDHRANQPQPYNMSMPGFGDVNFNNGTIQYNPDPKVRQLQDMSVDRALNALKDPNLNSIYQKSTAIGNQYLGPAAHEAFNTLPVDQYVDRFSNRQNRLFSDFEEGKMLNELRPDIDAMRRSSDYQNFVGAGLIQDSDFQELADRRLGLLREQADPYEQMQRNQLENRLFTQGTTGSKAGSMDRGSLSLTQSTADIERQLNAQTMADQMRQFNIGAGTNLIQGGTAARRTVGDLFGVGVNADNNRLLAGSDASYRTLQGQVTGTQAENQRRRDTLNDVKGLIGFGQDVRSDQTAQANSDYRIARDIFGDFNTAANTAAAPGGSVRQRGYSGGGGLSERELLDLFRYGWNL
jgi:hypothetical protein